MHESSPPGRTESPSPSPSTSPRLAFAALMACNLCLAFGPWLVRLSDTGPVAAGFWRLALAAPVLLLLAGRPARAGARLSPAMLGMIAFGGLFFAADLAAWHVGILHTKLANATLFANMSGLLFPLYGFLVARAWPSRGQTVALLLAAAGAAVLLGRSYELSLVNLWGDLLCLLAGLFYLCYLVTIDRARASLRPWPLLALSTVAGALPLLLFALLLGERILPHDWTPLLALAFVSQVMGQGFLVYAVGHLRPLVIGLGLLVQPVAAAAIGWIVYDERLGLLDMLGAAAIATALVLVRGSPRAEPKARPAPPEELGGPPGRA